MLSISQDTSSNFEINKYPCTILRKIRKIKNEKINKAEEGKGFLCREVMQVTPPGY